MTPDPGGRPATIVVMQFEVTAEAVFRTELETALTTLARRTGYERGRGARSLDDPGTWVLVTEWETVGAYRRALGHYDVKINATPLLARALDRSSAFEPLLEVAADGTLSRATSDRSATRTRPWTISSEAPGRDITDRPAADRPAADRPATEGPVESG